MDMAIKYSSQRLPPSRINAVSALSINIVDIGSCAGTSHRTAHVANVVGLPCRQLIHAKRIVT